MRSFLGDFLFCMEEATCAINIFLSKSIRSNCVQPSPCLKGTNPTQSGHHILKKLALEVASKFGSYI